MKMSNFIKGTEQRIRDTKSKEIYLLKNYLENVIKLDKIKVYC